MVFISLYRGQRLMTFNEKVCPFCQCKDVDRIHRGFWMRTIPSSRFYECNGCLRSYFVMFSWRTHKTPNAPSEGPRKVFWCKRWFTGYYFPRLNFTIRTLEYIPPFFILIVGGPVTANDSAPVFGVDLEKDWSERFSMTVQ